MDWIIIILSVLTIWNVIDIRALKVRNQVLEDRISKIRKCVNNNAKRAGEQLRSFRELAGLLGYDVDIEHEVKFTLTSILGCEEPEHSKKLVITKRKPNRKK